MYTITANASGTRSIDITVENLQTILRFSLFNNLVDSNGIVDDGVVDKLRMNTRALVESTGASDKALMDLCFNVIYHPNMKSIALKNLIDLYNNTELKEGTADN
ncbi:MAG: hypothetical protein Q4E63_09395 [Prevotellaceae bacterium]|nr:hypothetical protein [Prevotellaceae bacterium]